MNLIELENLVKGAPDDYLVKEVQQPTGKVPPFLALSEIQRRKDMRDRYMAQKNEGAKPTIAEQLVGGIGSMGGAEAPEGAPIPTPSATGIPSTGAPPVAAGAAPMPTPQGMPQGFAAGGIVGYAKGGETAPAKDYMEGYWEKYFPGLLQGAERAKMAVAKVPLTLTAAPGLMAAKDMMNFIPAGQEGYRPLYLSDEHAALDVKMKEREKNAEKMAAAIKAPGAPPLDYLRRPDAPIAANVPPEVSVPAPTGNAPRSSGASGYAVAPGGIGSIDPAEALAGPPVSAPSGGVAPVAGVAGRSGPYGSKAEAEYAALLENKDAFKLPEALNYEEFIQAAGAEEAAIREEAKRQAIGAALVQLGAGLSAGDMAKGFTTAGAESRDILSQGRKEASAQKALAQQFKLQGMEGARNQAIQQQELELSRARGAAEFQGGMRKERQDQANEDRRIAMEGARISASLQEARIRGQINERDFQIATRAGIEESTTKYIQARIGAPPTKAQEAWESLSPGLQKGVAPMEAYIEKYNALEPQARAAAITIYTGQAPAARPSSGGPTTRGGASATRPVLKYDSVTGGWK